MFIIKLAILNFNYRKEDSLIVFLAVLRFSLQTFFYTWVDSFIYKCYNQDERYSFILLAIKQPSFSWKITKHSAFNFIDHWIWIQMKVFYFILSWKDNFSHNLTLLLLLCLFLFKEISKRKTEKWKWICQGFVKECCLCFIRQTLKNASCYVLF